MDALKKFELMEKVGRELEDLKKSQQAVLEKIGKIEVDNIELADSSLENILPLIFQETAENADEIGILQKSFQERTLEFGEKNKVNKLKEQQQINRMKG